MAVAGYRRGRRRDRAAASVEHLVYSSVGGAERHTGIPHFDSKRRVEEHIESLDIPATESGKMLNTSSSEEEKSRDDVRCRQPVGAAKWYRLCRV